MGLTGNFSEFLNKPRLDREYLVPIIGIAAASTIIYQSFCLLTSSSNSLKGQQLKEIPVPSSCYPIVGHTFSLGEIPGETVKRWHEEYGPVIKLKLGNRVWIMIADPVLAHNIFVTHGSSTSFRPHSNFAHKMFSAGGKNLAFSQPGESWKTNRAAVLSILQPKQIEKYIPSIQKEAHGMAQRMMDYTEREGSVDPLKHIRLNFMNVIFGHCFGKTFNSVENQEFLELAQLVEDSMKFLAIEVDYSNFFPFLANLDFLTGGTIKKMGQTMEKRTPLFKQYIRETELKQEDNFVKALNESKYDLDEDEKLVILFEFVVAGTDPLSVATNWIVAILCHYPEVQQRVQRELDSFASNHGRLPGFDDRLQTPYSFAVIRECMRFKATSYFGLAHSVSEDVVVDGYLLPKGCIISPSMLSINEYPDFYESPNEFNPERFLSNTKSMTSATSGSIQERDHSNFGFGRRLCVGIHLAEVELYYTFVHLLSRCTIEPSSSGELPNLSTSKNGGISHLPLPYHVKFTRRTNASI